MRIGYFIFCGHIEQAFLFESRHHTFCAQHVCPKSIKNIMNGVPVAPHGLILGEDGATASRKLSKPLQAPFPPAWGPKIEKHIGNRISVAIRNFVTASHSIRESPLIASSMSKMTLSDFATDLLSSQRLNNQLVGASSLAIPSISCQTSETNGGLSRKGLENEAACSHK